MPVPAIQVGASPSYGQRQLPPSAYGQTDQRDMFQALMSMLLQQQELSARSGEAGKTREHELAMQNLQHSHEQEMARQQQAATKGLQESAQAHDVSMENLRNTLLTKFWDKRDASARADKYRDRIDKLITAKQEGRLGGMDADYTHIINELHGHETAAANTLFMYLNAEKARLTQAQFLDTASNAARDARDQDSMFSHLVRDEGGQKSPATLLTENLAQAVLSQAVSRRDVPAHVLLRDAIASSPASDGMAAVLKDALDISRASDITRPKMIQDFNAKIVNGQYSPPVVAAAGQVLRGLGSLASTASTGLTKTQLKAGSKTDTEEVPALPFTLPPSATSIGFGGELGLTPSQRAALPGGETLTYGLPGTRRSTAPLVSELAGELRDAIGPAATFLTTHPASLEAANAKATADTLERITTPTVDPKTGARTLGNPAALEETLRSAMKYHWPNSDAFYRDPKIRAMDPVARATLHGTLFGRPPTNPKDALIEAFDNTTPGDIKTLASRIIGGTEPTTIASQSREVAAAATQYEASRDIAREFETRGGRIHAEEAARMQKDYAGRMAGIMGNLPPDKANALMDMWGWDDPNKFRRVAQQVEEETKTKRGIPTVNELLNPNQMTPQGFTGQPAAQPRQPMSMQTQAISGPAGVQPPAATAPTPMGPPAPTARDMWMNNSPDLFPAGGSR